MTESFESTQNNNIEKDVSLPTPEDPAQQQALIKDILSRPSNVPYDGSNVARSKYMQEGYPGLSADLAESVPVDSPNADQQNQNQQEQSPQLDIASENQLLKSHIQKYETFLNQLLSLQNQTPEQPVSGPANAEQPKAMPEDAQSAYVKGKQDAILENMQNVKYEREFNSRKAAFEKENPDIVADPAKEHMVTMMAAQFINQGVDFDTAVKQAVTNFRKLNNPDTNLNMLQQKYNPQAENLNQFQQSHNIPQKSIDDYSKRASFFIEGASPSIPDKTFKASDLIDMQIYRPDEYRRLQPQIMKAYQEGRVLLD